MDIEARLDPQRFRNKSLPMAAFPGFVLEASAKLRCGVREFAEIYGEGSGWRGR